MHYSNKIKQQAVEQYRTGSTIDNIALKTGIARSTLYSWIRPRSQTQIDTVAQQAKQAAHIHKLEAVIEVLQLVNCSVTSPLQEKLREMANLHGQYRVHVLCEALKVPRGTFYNHLFRNKKENSSYQIRRVELSEQIKTIYDESNQIFGAKKIIAILSQRGIITCEKMVSELMREMNLCSIRLSAKHVRQARTGTKNRDALAMNFKLKLQIRFG